jgi:hypothetical protein
MAIADRFQRIEECVAILTQKLAILQEGKEEIQDLPIAELLPLESSPEPDERV